MAKQMVLNRKMYKEIKKMDHQDMSNYLSRYYMNAYNQGKEDSEGLKADELREILLTVKGIGPAKAENIMEAVGKALTEKGCGRCGSEESNAMASAILMKEYVRELSGAIKPGKVSLRQQRWPDFSFWWCW